MYLHLMQLSVTTNAMSSPSLARLIVVSLSISYSATAAKFGGSRAGSAFQLREMMVLAARTAVGEIAAQRVFAAGECQFRPRNAGFVIQRDFQAFRALQKSRLQQFLA